MPELDPNIMRSLLSTFRTEASEHLQTLNQSLLQLERTAEDDERQPLVQEAFRAAHSLKGAARAVSIHDVEVLAHAMETVLQQARDHNLALDVTVCDVLYDCLDAIETVLDQGDVDVDTLQSRLLNLVDHSTNGHQAAGELTVAETPENGRHGDEDKVPQSPLPTNGNLSVTSNTIRVSVGKLDDLMAQVGELLVSRISADQRLNDIRAMRYQIGQWSKHWRDIKALLPRVQGESVAPLTDVLHRHADDMNEFIQMFTHLDQNTNRDTLRLSMVTDNLQDKVRHVRMVPFQTLALSLERVVRDAGRSENKLVEFELQGQHIELDKKVLELLKDPLVHLLRNAVTHGIEPPEDRLNANKPESGQVAVKILQRGSEVHIHVIDDGRGIDVEALKQAYQRQYSNDDMTDMREDALSLAFVPGVSTAEEITELSGRGVGLDVVRERLEKMQGRITIDNKVGFGASFILTVPTSMAMTRGLIVRAGNDQYVLPLLSVEKIIEPEDYIVVSGKRMLKVDDKPLPLASLSTLLDRPDTRDSNQQIIAVILVVADQRLALLVDDAITEQELAVKPLAMPLKRVRNVTGTALLGNGEPVIVLNPADLVRSARGANVEFSPMRQEHAELAHSANILVVDDSITTRTLEKNILEAAGYTVITATDGREGIKKLHTNPVDIIVSDIEMPNMNGFELTRTVREDDKYGDMPIILVTSLESRDDRERGLVAGANAYIVKRGFDQAELLSTIEQLL